MSGGSFGDDSSLNQALVIKSETDSSLFKQLFGVTTTSAPFDFFVSLSSFLASVYLINNLYENSDDNDASRVQLMTVLSHSAFRIMFQAFVLPAFRHQGLRFNDQNQLISIDETVFKNSMAALLKIGAMSGFSACIFFAVTPWFYRLAGTERSLVDDSYQYIEIALPALFLQIINFGFQQTLVRMAKKNRMLRAAFINMLTNNLPILLLLLGIDPLPSLSPLKKISSVLSAGNVTLLLDYLRYFSQKKVLPSLSTYLDPNNVKEISEMFNGFKTVGFSIFLQLVSELGILYVQPFLVSACFKQDDVSSVLTQLGAAGVLNLFSIIVAITFSIATSNAVNIQAGHLSSAGDITVYCDNIRSIIAKSALVMLVFSGLLFSGLTVAAPQVMSLFYRRDDLDITGPSTNPYLFMSVIAAGTILDYLRNLALFILRSFNVNQYGTFASYFCLWLVNLALVYPVSQIENIGVFGILLPYYTGILVGMLMLLVRLRECIQNNETMKILADSEHESHQETVAEKERYGLNCFFSLYSSPQELSVQETERNPSASFEDSVRPFSS